MAVYRIAIKKRIQIQPSRGVDEWVNTYTVVSPMPYSTDELMHVADVVAPQFVAFEQQFHLEEVEFYGTQSTPILEAPSRLFAQRVLAQQGLRPFGQQASAGAAFVLWLGFQPVRNDWGKKDYRYAIHKDEFEPGDDGYRLSKQGVTEVESRLTVAKPSIQSLLRADPQAFSLVVSSAKDDHQPAAYQYRYVTDVQVRGVHIMKRHRR